MSFIILSLLALLISISASSERAQVDAKPLNQNQVKFRRLPPKEFSAALGSSITIECEAGASPPPTIHWLKNGKRIQQNDFDENQLEDGQAIQSLDDVNRIALSSTRSRLFVDCADFQDEAIYTCVAENAFSRISSHTKLNLIKPMPPAAAGGSAAGNENELLSGALEEVAALELVVAAGATPKQVAEELEAAQQEKSLSALPQCLSKRHLRPSDSVRIHMWTHNIVEIMKNDVVLYCRSNAKRQQLQQTSSAETQQLNNNNNQQPNQSQSLEQQQQQQSTSEKQQQNESNNKKTLVSWRLPNDELVSVEQKDKFEILETGDLLIKDLRWADMGSYVCTVSDEQSSDSVSTFVYPASVKAKSKRALLINSNKF